MTAHEIVYLDAVTLVDRYRTRALSPVDAVEAHLGRIARLEPRLNTYITLTADRARQRARESEARYARGTPKSALDGVPFAPKDNFATAGVRTTNGSKADADRVPVVTAGAVSRMDAAGAIMLGKLNLLEFATGSGTESGFGPARNPWNLQREPGGSSSGSGAALAAGLATVTLGTDTGGSIRQPAGRCGVVGLKPTYGRVSRHGVTPLAWTLDHAGPMARRVRDVARVLSVVAGHDERDASSVREPVADYEAALASASLRGRTFAVAMDLVEPCEPEVRAVFDAAVRHLEAAGARRIDATLPHAAAMNIASEIIINAEFTVYLDERMRDADRRGRIDPAVRLYATSGRFALAADYVRAQRLRLQLQAELEAALAQADVLVCPTDPTLTGRLGEATRLKGREVMWFEYGTLNLGNLTGAPGISVPCGFTPDGMPVGLQMYAGAFDESRLLAFAHAYEQSTDWHERRPPLE